jgi:hypothetical protein
MFLAGEILEKALGVAGLAAIVQFGTKRRGEFFGQAGRVIKTSPGETFVGQAGQAAHDGEIGFDGLLDVRPLHFDDDLGAVGQQGGINLGQRGRGDWLRIEGQE